MTCVLFLSAWVSVVPFASKAPIAHHSVRPKLIIRTVSPLTEESSTLTPPPAPAPVAAVVPAPVVAPPTPLFADTRPPVPRAPNNLQSFALVLLAISAVACAVLFLVRRRQRHAAANIDIDVIATRVFGPKHRVNVIEVDGRRMLISLGPDGVRLLCNLDGKEPMAASFERALHDSIASAPQPEPSAEVAGIIRLKLARAKGA